MNLSPLPKLAFLDNNGRPLVGGLLFTYEAGTSTKIATYTDESGNTQNTNPVVLDYRGEANVWLDDSLTYKYVLAPRSDTDPPTNPIWTVDNIPGGYTGVIHWTQIRYDRTAAEITAGVTPVNYYYPPLDVLRYGADPSNTNDSMGAFQAALDVAAVDGGEVFVPTGEYKLTGSINIYKFTRLIGEGWAASRLVFTHTGDGIKSTWPINSSTGVFISLSDISIENTNSSNTGAGFVDVGGTFINLIRVRFYGWFLQTIWDQSELADIHYCIFDGPLNGGGCIWLVNGPDYTPGALGLFTNRITVKYCQISGLSGRVGIIDDGGNTHCFEDNNYNGLTTHIRAAGVAGLRISGGEFETAASSSINFNYLRYFSGAGTGGCVAAVVTGAAELVPVNGTPCISIDAVESLTIDGGVYLGNTSVPKISGVINAAYLSITGVPQIGTSAMLDNESTILIVDGEHITPNVQSNDYTFVASDAGREVRNNSNSAYAYTIPPNSSVPFLVGTKIRVVSGGGAVTLTRGSGVTLYKTGGVTSADVVLSSGSSKIGVATLEKYDTNAWIVSGDPLT